MKVTNAASDEELHYFDGCWNKVAAATRPIASSNQYAIDDEDFLFRMKKDQLVPRDQV